LVGFVDLHRINTPVYPNFVPAEKLVAPRGYGAGLPANFHGQLDAVLRGVVKPFVPPVRFAEQGEFGLRPF
jgi:hypothetical protein